MSHTKATVATPTATYTEMESRFKLINALMGGTETMRAAGIDYLPQYDAESDHNYKVRLSRTTLTNFFVRTLEGLVGKPFAKPITLSEDGIPPEIEDWIEDIDLQGNHLNVFARTCFREGLAKGITAFLVDHPPASEDVQTVEDQQKSGNRPYFVQIHPEDIIAAFAEVRDGKEVLTHVRIRECEVVRNGWSEETVERIRVLEPGVWQLWRKADRGDEWVMEAQGVTTLEFIPLVIWYADRQCLMKAQPPLMDLAHLNVAHWQSSSDQRNVLTVARFPLLAASGVADDEGNKAIGPNKLLRSSDPNAKYYYVEHSGAAIEAGRMDLEDLKQEMSIFGLELLMSKPGNETATGKAIDTAENHSNLQSMCLTFADALTLGLYYMAAWSGFDMTGSVTINTDFGLKANQAADLATISSARTAKEISHLAYIHELKRRGVLADTFDVEEDAKALEEEKIVAVADEVFKQKELIREGVVPDPTTKQGGSTSGPPTAIK